MSKLINSLQKASLVAVLFFLASCATEYVATKPDEVIIEKSAPPGAGYAYRGPEWQWDKSKKVYVSVPGTWENRPSGVWVRGHWKSSKRGYVWVPGHWQ